MQLGKYDGTYCTYDGLDFSREAFEVPFNCPRFEALASTLEQRIADLQIGEASGALCDAGRRFLTDGGVEAQVAPALEARGFEAAYELVADAEGRAALDAAFREHAAAAERAGANLLLVTPTTRLPRGLPPDAVDDACRLAAEHLRDFRVERALAPGRVAVVAGALPFAGERTQAATRAGCRAQTVSRRRSAAVAFAADALKFQDPEAFVAGLLLLAPGREGPAGLLPLELRGPQAQRPLPLRRRPRVRRRRGPPLRGAAAPGQRREARGVSLGASLDDTGRRRRKPN